MRRIAVFSLAHALALASLLSVSSFATGCAADEADEREAAYPTQAGPVGTTPPNELGDTRPPPPSSPPPGAAPLAPPSMPPPGVAAPGAPASNGGVDFAAGAPPSDVIVSDGDGTQPGGPGVGPGGPPGVGPGGPPGVGPGGTPADGADGSDQYADTDPAALNDFRTTLDPYGSWVQDPNYGTVWVPSSSVVGDDFTPYVSDGHWTYDDGYADNYVWASDYAWGWAPFHYGRWAYASRGWSWIPGRQYAGAWVSWRYGEGPWGYVGWAPLAPTWGWRGGRAVSLEFSPRVGYSFVSSRDLFAPAVRSHVIGGAQASMVAEHSQPWAGARFGASGGFGGRFGPPPSVLNISAGSVVRTSATNPGVMQARAFARPSTGRAYGASAPQPMGVGARAGGSWTYRGASTSLSGDATRVQPAGYASATHFGGRLGGGFTGSASAARPSGGFYSGGTRSIGGGYSGYSGYSGGGRAYSGGAAPRSMGSPGGGFHVGGSAGGSVHSGGSVGGGFHGGGGGGFHGGGGGGGHGGHR